MVPLWNIYCFYLWIWSFFYIFDYVKISPIFVTTFAALFTIWKVVFSQYSHKYHVGYKKAIILWEVFIVFINYKKFWQDNRIDFMSTFYTNFLSFFIYACLIGWKGKNFCEVYFVDIPNQKELKYPLYKFIKLKIIGLFN